MADKELSNGNIERGWGQILPATLSDEIHVENHIQNGRSSKSFIAEGVLMRDVVKVLLGLKPYLNSFPY